VSSSTRTAPLVLLRWLLVPVAAAGIWYAALLSGLAAVSVLDMFCPAEQMISGMCAAPWHATAVELLVVIFAAAAAFAIVVVCALVAPAHRLSVAVIAFACGAVFAGYAASEGTMWAPFIAAAAGGSAGLVFARSRRARPDGARLRFDW
jgi:hypothetical protein